MNIFYKGGRGLYLPDGNKHTNYIGDIRRGRPMCRPFKHGPSNTRGRTHRCAPTLLLTLIFICCLFNNVQAQSPDREAVDGHTNTSIDITYKFLFNKRSYDHTMKVHPWADLERFPLVAYDLNYCSTPDIVVGDSIPEFVYHLPLNVVNQHGDRDIISLASLSDKELIVLDFWAPWCSPCVESMDNWNIHMEDLPTSIGVIGMMLDYDYKAQRFGLDRGWHMPIAYGAAIYIMNSFFFDRQVVSRSVWIKDGRLIAITGTGGYDLQMVKDIMEGKAVDLPMAYEWTYSQPNP